MAEKISKKGKGGFASMDEEKQRAIASMGGRAAHESGNAHEFTSEEARVAGRKGGEAPHSDRGSNQSQAAQGQQPVVSSNSNTATNMASTSDKAPKPPATPDRKASNSRKPKRAGQENQVDQNTSGDK